MCFCLLTFLMLVGILLLFIKFIYFFTLSSSSIICYIYTALAIFDSSFLSTADCALRILSFLMDASFSGTITRLLSPIRFLVPNLRSSKVRGTSACNFLSFYMISNLLRPAPELILVDLRLFSCITLRFSSFYLAFYVVVVALKLSTCFRLTSVI